MAIGALFFLIIIRLHQRVQFSLYRYLILEQFLESQIQRLKRDWEHLPPPSLLYVPADHPYAQDLDLVGMASLHHLCDTSVSLEGSQKLADWLLEPVQTPGVLIERQKIVQALQRRTLFRQELFLKAQEIARSSRHRQSQARWWQASKLLQIVEKLPRQSMPRSLLPLLMGFAFLHWFLHLARFLGLLSGQFWQIALGIYVLLFWFNRKFTHHLLQDAFQLHVEVSNLARLFNWLEIWGRKSIPELQPIFSSFTISSPRRLFQTLQRLVSWASLQSNPLAWLVVNLIFPCDYWIVWRFEHFKFQIVQQLPQWLEGFASLEAACSLANLAWLHPDYHFPTLHSGSTLLRFEAGGHPLLDPAKRIRNSLEIHHCQEICFITGSNMSGKSTFLKSIGLNLVLAQAGGPVDAEIFEWQPLRLFACIRIHDSITAGLSYLCRSATLKTAS